MKQEIKIKRTEYGFITAEVTANADIFKIAYEEYTAGNINWGNEEFEVIDESKLHKYVWKDIVYVNNKFYSEAFEISGEMDDKNTYRIDEFLEAVALKYKVDTSDVKTYMMDNIDFDTKGLMWGAAECGCYIDGKAEFVVPQTEDNRLKSLFENALSVIKEYTENLDENDYQEEYISVLQNELGMTANEIAQYAGIEVDDI